MTRIYQPHFDSTHIYEFLILNILKTKRKNTWRALMKLLSNWVHFFFKNLYLPGKRAHASKTLGPRALLNVFSKHEYFDLLSR